MPVFSDAAGCFLRPLQGLPPGGGDFLIGQFQLFGECARLRPLTRFLSQHQLVQRPETSTSLRKRIYPRTHSARGQKWAGGQQSAVRAVRARAPLRLSLWQELVSHLLYRRSRGGTSGETTSPSSPGRQGYREGRVSNALQRRELGCGSSWPTLVMPKCGKLRAFPPCAVGHFMSNIKMFPMALLPGWPFAPNKTPGAKTV